MAEERHALEKRGVVRYGWTPPPNSLVVCKPGQTNPALPVFKETSAGEAEEKLDDDLTKRLAERVAKGLK